MSTIQQVKYDDMTKEALVAELKQRDEKEKYNGWCNRETWAFNLLIASDLPMEMAEDAYAEAVASEDKYLTTEDRARRNLSERLKEHLEMLRDEIAPESRDVLMMLDDIGSSWRIDFTTIAAYKMDAFLLEQ